jgi:hypothetical protein
MRGSSHIQPKTSVKDSRLSLLGVCEFTWLPAPLFTVAAMLEQL